MPHSGLQGKGLCRDVYSLYGVLREQGRAGQREQLLLALYWKLISRRGRSASSSARPPTQRLIMYCWTSMTTSRLSCPTPHSNFIAFGPIFNHETGAFLFKLILS